jgi:hypothetical protein
MIAAERGKTIPSSIRTASFPGLDQSGHRAPGFVEKLAKSSVMK